MKADNGPQINRTDSTSLLSCVYKGIQALLQQDIALLISNAECGRKSRRRKMEGVCGKGGWEAATDKQTEPIWNILDCWSF